MTTHLPYKIDEDIKAFTLPSELLQDQIIEIEKANHLPQPEHNHVFVYLKNGFIVSILQGPVTFNAFEIAVKKDNKLVDYFTDEDGSKDQIYRTDDPKELVKIMEDVSYL